MITVARALSRSAGGCNACLVSYSEFGMPSEPMVNVIHMSPGSNSLQVRLCDKCMNELIHKAAFVENYLRNHRGATT